MKSYFIACLFIPENRPCHFNYVHTGKITVYFKYYPKHFLQFTSDTVLQGIFNGRSKYSVK